MKLPEKGFYYHYKHDFKGPINIYAYEVLGTARHSEDESYLVVYRPLYKSEFSARVDFCARPLEMFIEKVNVNGNKMPRFQKIVDTDIVSKLQKLV
jgi:hypothetical protein